MREPIASKAEWMRRIQELGRQHGRAVSGIDWDFWYNWKRSPEKAFYTEYPECERTDTEET